jgi:hypothetical protein
MKVDPRFRSSRLAEYTDKQLEAHRDRFVVRADALRKLQQKYQEQMSRALTGPEFVNRPEDRAAAIKNFGARAVAAARDSERARKRAVACEVEQTLRRNVIDEG